MSSTIDRYVQLATEMGADTEEFKEAFHRYGEHHGETVFVVDRALFAAAQCNIDGELLVLKELAMPI